jgi:hypothetical protein
VKAEVPNLPLKDPSLIARSVPSERGHNRAEIGGQGTFIDSQKRDDGGSTSRVYEKDKLGGSEREEIGVQNE